MVGWLVKIILIFFLFTLLVVESDKMKIDDCNKYNLLNVKINKNKYKMNGNR
jgi:hypothetical protein